MKLVKVGVAIPNEGHTQAEAYANRLPWAFFQGMQEERAYWHEAILNSSLLPEEQVELLNARILQYDVDDVRFEFSFGNVGRLLVPFARERLAEQFLSMGMDLIFWIDDDMLGPSDTFFRLARNVLAGPADVCAALAFTRNPPHQPVIYRVTQGWDAVARQDYFLTRPVTRYQKDALVEADAVGFGCVVFRADILKRMAQPWFMSTCGSGEDVYFCIKARKAGARVFSDTRVKLGHLAAPSIITEATYEAHAANADAMARRETEGPEEYDPLDGRLYVAIG